MRLHALYENCIHISLLLAPPHAAGVPVNHAAVILPLLFALGRLVNAWNPKTFLVYVNVTIILSLIFCAICDPLTQVCLFITPLFFCLFLFALGRVVNDLIAQAADLTCGCKCTRCCYALQSNGSGPIVCGTSTAAPCNGTCYQTNEANCGVQFSTVKQLPFCAIPRPASWPPVLQVRALVCAKLPLPLVA